MAPEITYLVSNYNKGPYIEDCLASLQAQTCTQWRCLICDDKSTDDSLARIRPWLGDRIQLLQNDSNQGVIPTLERLIAAAPTDIVGVLDADDALYPQTTERLLAAYATNPQAGFVYSNWTDYSSDLQTPLGRGISRPIAAGGSTLVSGFVGAIRTFRVSVYRRTTGLDPATLYAEDRDLVYKMEEVTPLIYLDEELYKYRQLPHSQSHDPAKLEVMLHGTACAYRNALDRRGIRGLKRWGYELYIVNSYWGRQQHSPRLRRIAHYSWRLTRLLVRLMNCR